MAPRSVGRRPPGPVPRKTSTWATSPQVETAAARRGTLGDAAEVLTREEAVARGWFGPVSPTVVPRLGDVLVACRDRASVVSTVGWAHESRLVGLHGSLTPDEMLIPVLID